MPAISDPGLKLRHRRRTKRGARIAVVLALLALFMVGTAAASADADLFPGAGRPALDAGVMALDPATELTFNVPTEGLAPGGTSRVRHAMVNTAGMPLRYAVVSETADADGKGLREMLQAKITACDRVDVTLLYAGPLGPATAGFGDAASGAQRGDRILGPGERVTLCFEVTMSREAGNEYQGATTSTTWTIVSEQVAGNP